VTYTPNDEQADVIAATDPVLLVLGGAGTGKTTTAAAAARTHLERVPLSEVSRHSRRSSHAYSRVLFLSFSRASVSRILERSSSLLGDRSHLVDVTTFHALAWSLVRRFGNLIGHPAPLLMTEAEAKLFQQGAQTLRYSDLVPLALELLDLPVVARHGTRRWDLIICDEYQDTDEKQFQMLQALRGASTRLLLLGDPNQCIYSSLPGVEGVGPERLQAALALPGARQVDLPAASFRDPSGVLPAAAAAIRQRLFEDPAVGAALSSGRLRIRAGLPQDQEGPAVAEVVEVLRAEGNSVAVFSHHNDALARLSDQLSAAGVKHETTGLPESVSAALDALVAMLEFSQGVTEWDTVRQALAVFVTSAVRGAAVPNLARMLLGQVEPPASLAERLDALEAALRDADLPAALATGTSAHAAIGLPTKATSWERAAGQLRPMLASSLRGATSIRPTAALARLEALVVDQRMSLLTDTVAEHEPPVQLMGLYQTKGREADATVIILRATDFFGTDRAEPFEEGSRLMYVVFTRARINSVVLIFGSGLPGLVAPLARLASEPVQ
jgi:DNA helicase-2/ATP-dependent DNA helicase PcrA